MPWRSRYADGSQCATPVLELLLTAGGLRRDAETAGKLFTLLPSVSTPGSDDLPRGVMPAVPLLTS